MAYKDAHSVIFVIGAHREQVILDGKLTTYEVTH